MAGRVAGDVAEEEGMREAARTRGDGGTELRSGMFCVVSEVVRT